MNVETIKKSSFLTARLENENEISVTKENEVSFKVLYRLICLESPRKIFVITAESDSEYDAVCITGDEIYAKSIFRSVIKNQVTPCVLTEVLRDMMA